MISTRIKRYLKFSLISLIVIESFLLAYFMRPMQDDYFNLYSVQTMGLFGMLKDTWEFHGGNMIQFLIHGVVITPTTGAFAYWNLGLFFIVTELLVFFSVRKLLTWVFTSNSSTVRFWVPLLSVVGFEGIFVPGFLGAYGFSLAALAHLWPVMAFTYGLIGLKRFRGSWAIAFLLGLIAGNSNLAESFFACGAWVLTFLALYKIEEFGQRSGVPKDLAFFTLGAGTFLGTIVIAVAPGFWIRANDQVGLPETVLEFAIRFARSFASFTADGLSHPMVWVVLLLGLLMAHKNPEFKLEVSLFRLRILSVGMFLMWMALIMGSTFAYPAWHQSMGMYVLLMPLAFGVGVSIRMNLQRWVLVSALAVSSMVMLLVFLRVGVMGINRAIVWDRNLHSNTCLIERNLNAELLGAEIQYPPFNLGIEDVNTWEWMRGKYVGWVEGIPEKRCD